MIARIRTTLPAPPERVWRILLERDAFLDSTRGMLGFRDAESWPERFHEGQRIDTTLLAFGRVPCWQHTIRIVRIDHESMEITSRESGGPVRRWNHRKWIEPTNGPGCAYVDEIDLEAGWLTPLVWAYAHTFYRYRQSRMRRLLERMA